MNDHLKRLALAGSPALSSRLPDGCIEELSIGSKLLELLRAKNGFYAFESALHVFPCGGSDGFMDIIAWNAPSLWKSAYAGRADAFTFFAEDAFGVQFGLSKGEIFTFDPETGNSVTFAQDCEEWAQRILSDYNLHTGYSLARKWQLQNGELQAGWRIVPRVPFVVGGQFDVPNLVAMESVSSMKFRASIASQIREVPDGTKLQLKFI